MSTNAVKGNNLQITLFRTKYANTRKQRETLRSLGLRRPHQSVVKPNTPMILGMVNVIRHMVEVEEI